MHSQHVPLLLLGVCCMFTTTWSAGTFTSLVHLHRAIQAESDITQHINNYISLERNRLLNLESLLGELTEHHAELSAGNTERHLSNPVNAFLVTSRMFDLVSESTELISAQSKYNLETYHNKSANVHSHLPVKDDIDGAVLALLRIQDTYSLDTTQLSDSNLGLESSDNEAPPLSGDDCFRIGKTAFVMHDYYHSVFWFQTALKKYDSVGQVADYMYDRITTTLDYLNFSFYKQGNLELAISAAERWTAMEPGAEPGTTNLGYYYQELEEAGRTYSAHTLPPLSNVRNRTGFSATEPFKVYETLCQGGQLPKFSNRTRRLKCRYRPTMYSYYPSLEEEFSLEPRLVYIHRVITDSEIQRIKDLAKPKLDRSGVFASNSATPVGGVKTHTRVSKSAWIWDSDDPVIKTLSVRFSRVTGLTLDYAESLQVLNYGIGGHYEPHCDFARVSNPDVFAKGAGNRLATLILYLTDVEKGGATVFPHLGATVWPEKGGAAFWFNLKENGDLDERTLHGACPVLVGYKWVCNKWFHETMNEFTRPCPLDEQSVV